MDSNRTSNTDTSATAEATYSTENINIYLEHSKIILVHGFYSTISFILVCMAGICSIIGCFFLELSLLLNSYMDVDQYRRSVYFIKGINNEIYNVYSNKLKNTIDPFIQEPRKNIEIILTPILNKMSNYITSIHDEEVEYSSTVNIKLEPIHENSYVDSGSGSDSSSISHISLGECDLDNLSTDDSSSEISETLDDIIDVTDEMISKIQKNISLIDLTIINERGETIQTNESTHSDETNESTHSDETNESTHSDETYETEEEEESNE